MYFWMFFHADITIIYTLYTYVCGKQLQDHRRKKTQPFLICIFWVPLTTKDFLTLANEAFLLTSRSHRRFDQYNFITCQMGGAQHLSKCHRCFKGVKVCQGLCQCVKVHVFVGCVSFVKCLSIVILALKVADWTKLTAICPRLGGDPGPGRFLGAKETAVSAAALDSSWRPR